MKSGKSIVEDWLYARISPITINVYRAPAPRTIARDVPWVAVQCVGGDADRHTVGTPFGMEVYRYQVDCYVEGRDARDVQTLMQRIHEAISSVKVMSADGGVVQYCMRYMTVPIDHEEAGDVITQRVGAIYEVSVLPTR